MHGKMGSFGLRKQDSIYKVYLYIKLYYKIRELKQDGKQANKQVRARAHVSAREVINRCAKLSTDFGSLQKKEHPRSRDYGLYKSKSKRISRIMRYKAI
jgi:hypothetical protein